MNADVVTTRAETILRDLQASNRTSWREDWAECPSCGAVITSERQLRAHARECHWLRRDVQDTLDAVWMPENAHNR